MVWRVQVVTRLRNELASTASALADARSLLSAREHSDSDHVHALSTQIDALTAELQILRDDSQRERTRAEEAVAAQRRLMGEREELAKQGTHLTGVVQALQTRNETLQSTIAGHVQR